VCFYSVVAGGIFSLAQVAHAGYFNWSRSKMRHSWDAPSVHAPDCEGARTMDKMDQRKKEDMDNRQGLDLFWGVPWEPE